MNETLIAPKTLVLIDPSSPHGEGGLSMLSDDDHAVTLLLTLNGRSAAALRDYAESENIDVSMAGLLYLDQVVRRLSAYTDDIETISTTDPDGIQTILDVLAHRSITRVVVPSSLPGLEGGRLERLLEVCPVPVFVAPQVVTTGSEFPIAS